MLLDSGFNLDLVWEIMLSFLDLIMSFSNLHLNPARLLQELCPSHKWNLEFSKVEQSKKGAPFVIDACVTMENISLRSRAIHRSKKAVERISAEEIYLKWKAQGYKPKKGKTLEHILKVTKKEEAKLIGYDETPVAEALLLDCIKLEDLDIQDCSLPAETNDSCTNTMAEEPTNIPNSVPSADNPHLYHKDEIVIMSVMLAAQAPPHKMELLIVVDDEDEDVQEDLTMATSLVSPQTMAPNFYL